MTTEITDQQTYQDCLKQIVSTIRGNKRKAVSSINEQVLKTYWEVGRLIEEKKQAYGWGSGVIKELSKDITAHFPNERRGYSKRNLENMVRFYKTYPKFAQSVTAQLTFTHYMILISRTKLEEERAFYTDLVAKHNWTVNELEHQINTSLFERVVLSQTSIKQKRDHLLQLKTKNPDPSYHFRDEYVLDFLKGETIETEKDLENAILKHLESFFLEWGRGAITLAGRQYPCDIDGNEHRIDLLFYHRELECLLALELKMDKFKAEYAGQMAKYLGYLDAKERYEGDQPSFGIILCKSADQEEIEFTLNYIASDRLKVATYTDKLPDKKLLQEQVKKIKLLTASCD